MCIVCYSPRFHSILPLPLALWICWMWKENFSHQLWKKRSVHDNDFIASRTYFDFWLFFSVRIFSLWMPNGTQLNSLSNHDGRLLARAYNQQPRVLDGLILKRPSRCMSLSPQFCQIARRLSLCEKWKKTERWSRYDVRHFMFQFSSSRLLIRNMCRNNLNILTIPW